MPKKISRVPTNTTEQPNSMSQAIASAQESIPDMGINHASAYYNYTDYSNILPGISSRPGMTRGNYNSYRPNDAVPTRYTDIIAKCEQVYWNVGIIHNIINLMAEFASQGIRVVHPNKKIEKFCQNWFNNADGVNGPERSERFLNYLYRTGNPVVRRLEAKVGIKVKRDIQSGYAAETEVTQTKVKNGVIPWQYVFYNPQQIRVLEGELGCFIGRCKYGLKLSEKTKTAIKSAQDNGSPEAKKALSKLPKEVLDAVQHKDGVVPLPEDKIRVFHYKKDDWQQWANPMIYPILNDITTLMKLKLCDLTALDGAISNIRIFKLGDLQHNIAPTPAMFSKLNSILESNVGGGTMDLVWTPDIELIETQSKLHQFLGKEKYEPTLDSIYQGLGIPQTLSGQSGGGGTTNNYISLKTLINRLDYGRTQLIAFWQHEFMILQRAMGFKVPPTLEFDYQVLEDESTANKLLMDMVDRNIISDETLRHKIKLDNEMELVRIQRENKEKDSEKLPPKAGLFNNPQALEMAKINAENKNNSPNSNQNGRPKGEKDTVKRKEKKFAPKTKASLKIWATDAYHKIGEILLPGVLNQFSKSNLRQLTSKEQKIFEDIKIGVLTNISPLSLISEELVVSTMRQGVSYPNYEDQIQEVAASLNRALTIDEIRELQISTYIDTLKDTYGDY